MKKYTALMIDLKNSRAYSTADRNLIQKNIMHILQKLNQIFHHSMEKEVEFSAGDEVQGLFCLPEAAYLYFRFFQMLLYPIKIHAGIGIGNWDVVMENASSTAQDGSAYHNARKAIEEVKKSLEYSILIYSGTKYDFILNSLIASVEIISQKQNENQNKIMLLSELYFPITMDEIMNINEICKLSDISKNIVPLVTDISEIGSPFFISNGKKRGLSTQLSEILGISRQSIEKTIKTANIYEIRNIVISILKSMRDYYRGERI